MRTFLVAFFIWTGVSSLGAQDYGLYWKYKDYDGIALTVPSFAIDIGSWFMGEKTERVLLRKVNKVRVMYFENGENPVTERDLKRFERKAKRRHLEDLVLVRHGKTHIRVMAKESRNAIRKIVVFVQSPEEFAMVSIKGRFRWDDINRVIEKYGKGTKKDGKPLLPSTIKVPVSRI